MAECKNCKQDKKHLKSTYIQLLTKQWHAVRVEYYCHECIRNHWFVREEITRLLKKYEIHKLLRTVPELDNHLEEKSLSA